MAKINERKLAMDILQKVKTENKAVGTSLNDCFGARESLEKRSRAFITCLVYGTLENLIKIDYVIDKFSKIKVRKMRPQVAIIMEMSVYQLLFMDNIPQSAVCNEAVKLVGKSYLASLKGFVNGVIRNIARNIDSIEFPSWEDDPVESISVEYSIPRWVLEIWTEQMSINEIGYMVSALRKQKHVYIRCNTSLISPAELKYSLERNGIEVSVPQDCPEYAMSIGGFDSIENIKEFKEGKFYVQDLSCIISGSLYGLKKGDRVLDVCAAPGGKSINTALILHEKGGGRVTACDISEFKTQKIIENVKRLHIDNIEVKVSDASIPIEEKYDVVIADVPCSGFGIIGRKPDILFKRQKNDMQSLILLQKSIVSAAANSVSPGGRFIYSTCTINKEENEKMSEWITENFAFEKVAESQMIPGKNGDTDGFYTAVFLSV